VAPPIQIPDYAHGIILYKILEMFLSGAVGGTVSNLLGSSKTPPETTAYKTKNIIKMLGGRGVRNLTALVHFK